MKLRDRIILWLKPKSSLRIMTWREEADLKNEWFDKGRDVGILICARQRDTKGRFKK